MKLINNLSKNISIILITHDKNIISNMNRIVKLKKGKIIYDKYIN